METPRRRMQRRASTDRYRVELPPQPSMDLDLSDMHDEGFEEENVAEQLKEELGHHETRAINGLKIIVLALLGFSGIGVGFAVFFYIRNSDRSEFEEQFNDDANKVLAALGSSLDGALGALDTFAVSIVSFAAATNQTWPFVTVSDFAIRAAKMRTLSKAVVMNLYMNVQPEQREEWENYTSQNNYWVEESLDVMEADGFTPIYRDYELWDVIHGYDELENDEPTGTTHPGPYLPWWQSYPMIPNDPPYNWDLMTSAIGVEIEQLKRTNMVVLSPVYLIAEGNNTEPIEENEDEARWIGDFLDPDEEPNEPVSDFYYPILPQATKSIRVFPNHEPSESAWAGILAMTFYWRDRLENLLPVGSNGIRVVFSSKCNPTFTYQINGPSSEYLGTVDAHENQYDDLALSANLVELKRFNKETDYTGIPLNDEVCEQQVRVYPSSVMENDFQSEDAVTFAICAALIFVFTSAVFIFYDYWVAKRQNKVMESAVQSNEILASLFPAVVRERMLEGVMNNSSQNGNRTRSSTKRTKGLDESDSSSEFQETNNNDQIADLYPNATVLFADIAGFTAWSSARGPSQVFSLLERIYGAFDRLANKRRVFKVETIGDCYVAATGLPRAQPRHAIIMAKFAHDCRRKFQTLTRDLEKLLGPGTADLALRVGLHSGPVTAGVLRGQKARFQLFGDTVNTAARMESNGKPHWIHCSQQTADLLIMAGRGGWLTQRDELITAKGKGRLQTYWVEVDNDGQSTMITDLSPDAEFDDEGLVPTDELLGLDDAERRMVDWNRGLLEDLLKTLIAHRGGLKQIKNIHESLVIDVAGDGVPIEEMMDEITFPPYKEQGKSNGEDLDTSVREQLHSFVTAVACSYSQNPFHSFEHASCVAMSTEKMLSALTHEGKIVMDPLSQFALAFAALIHDMDHPAVSNAVLVEEGSSLVTRYGTRSIAKQNAIDIAWGLLMDEAFEDLQRAIFPTKQDQKLFRQLLIHAVLATEFFDPELKTAREKRYKSVVGPGSSSANLDLKMTVLVDLISQASSIAHTMQHWAVYEKWNKRLFDEEVRAFERGRTKKNPANFWVAGEVNFFKVVVMPLANKLQEIQVFGKECQDFLPFATQNRDQWTSFGDEFVAEWTAERSVVRAERESAEQFPDSPSEGSGPKEPQFQFPSSIMTDSLYPLGTS